MELRNKSLHFVQNDPNREAEIVAKLAQWWNEAEDHMDPDGPYPAPPYAATVLSLLRHESVISLYRPVLATSRKDAAHSTALQHCIFSARSIITSLHNAIHKSTDGGDSTSTLSLLWPSCSWAVWISTFIMFYAVNDGHVERNVVMR